MYVLDRAFPTPAENLACDEALLEESEAGGGPEVLRFWESPVPFVVLGYTKKVDEEVDVAACRAAGVPILRRYTGGGTVLQGPGCLNFAVVLDMHRNTALQGVSEANAFIMARQQAALSPLVEGDVTIAGITDLTWRGRKFSGNAQRRKRHFLLFHGTILWRSDLDLISRLLRLPPEQPAYRGQRAHADFVTNIGLDAATIKSALTAAWQAQAPLLTLPAAKLAELLPRYNDEAWNLRY